MVTQPSLPHTLTPVYVYGTLLDIDRHLYLEVVMGAADTSSAASAGDQDLVERVRARYAAAALAVRTDGQPAEDCGCGAEHAPAPAAAALPAPHPVPARAPSPAPPPSGPDVAEAGEGFGAVLYTSRDRSDLPAEAVLASLGCGNPTAVADLHPGEIVLDLGSGGGIDVLLSAQRVGPTGRAYGLDMTDEMLDLARHNASRARRHQRRVPPRSDRDIPLPGESVDVIISNCVVNLSTDKPAVLSEIARVLRPGGRIGISDVVAEDFLSPADRAARGSHVGCIAGALTVAEYREGLDRRRPHRRHHHRDPPGHGRHARRHRPRPQTHPGGLLLNACRGRFPATVGRPSPTLRCLPTPAVSPATAGNGRWRLDVVLRGSPRTIGNRITMRRTRPHHGLDAPGGLASRGEGPSGVCRGHRLGGGRPGPSPGRSRCLCAPLLASRRRRGRRASPVSREDHR